MRTLISADPISGFNPEHGRLIRVSELVSPGRTGHRVRGRTGAVRASGTPRQPGAGVRTRTKARTAHRTSYATEHNSELTGPAMTGNRVRDTTDVRDPQRPGTGHRASECPGTQRASHTTEHDSEKRKP